MVHPVDVNRFQGQAVHRLHQQHIQLGLRKGMAVLVYYRVQSGPHVNEVFQAVLIAHESVANRGKKTDNKLWKRVVPSETEFAWLPPDIAWAFCSDALRRRGDCQYLAFHEAHMGLQGRAFQANIFIVDMVFLGDTRSAEELAVFTNMAPERLCLGCGLRAEEKFTPIFPGERGPLFAASVKLLQFALRASSASASAKGLTEEEGALLQAIRPLVTNPDCHFLAVLTVLVQSVLEGRTDCPISGVFGAGKTRAAAAFSCARVNGVYPPLALAEAFITEEDSAPRVRRLHLMVVDLHRRRRMADRVLRLLSDIQVDRCADECWNTLPIPWKRNQEAYQLRYVFGYAMDGSDLPCYILWPTRTVEQSFWCIDAWKGDWVRLDKCSFMAPVGVEHFFDAFCFDPQRPWRAAACQALGIPSCHVSEDTHLEQVHENKFSLHTS